jgi:hypothetical protein
LRLRIWPFPSSRRFSLRCDRSRSARLHHRPDRAGIAAFLAVWIPARWASRVTPMTLLRHD